MKHIAMLVALFNRQTVGVGKAIAKIVFTPKCLVDRHIAEGLEDVKKGRTHGPYASAGEAVEARAKRRAKNRSA